VHEIQAHLWTAIQSKQIMPGMSLREMGAVIGVEAPQLVKHHLDQLRKLGTISFEDGDYKF
jgi:hypothetical protein